MLTTFALLKFLLFEAREIPAAAVLSPTERPMRVAVIVLGLVVVSTPSQASRSCMTRAEARQQFPTSHLYWYGSGHCWHAMTQSRRRVVHRVRENVQREAQRDPAEPNNPEPKWREMAMLPENEAPSPRQMEPAQKSAPEATFDDLWQYRVDTMSVMFLDAREMLKQQVVDLKRKVADLDQQLADQERTAWKRALSISARFWR
jgi:hypothetical protein